MLFHLNHAGKVKLLFGIFILELPVYSNKTKTYQQDGEHNLFWLDISVCLRSLLGIPLVEEHKGISHYRCTYKLITKSPVSVPVVKCLLELHFCDCCLGAHERIVITGILCLLLFWGTAETNDTNSVEFVI